MAEINGCQRCLYNLKSDLIPPKKKNVNRLKPQRYVRYTNTNTIQRRGSETQKFVIERVDEGKITKDVCKKQTNKQKNIKQNLVEY